MLLKLLKYNIMTAIALTVSLWTVENNPLLKQEVQELMGVTQEEIKVQRTIASIENLSETESNELINSLTDEEIEEIIEQAQIETEKKLEFFSQKREAQALRELLKTKSDRKSKISKIVSKIAQYLEKSIDSKIAASKKDDPNSQTFFGGGYFFKEDKDKDKDKNKDEEDYEEADKDPNPRERQHDKQSESEPELIEDLPPSMEEAPPAVSLNPPINVSEPPVIPNIPTANPSPNPNNESSVPNLNIFNGSFSTQEDTPLVARIIYSQSQSYPADNCEVLNSTNGTIYQPCSCNNGECSFGFQPATNYNGVGTVTYKLSRSGQSKTVTQNVQITSVDDPAVFSFISPIKIYSGIETKVSFNVYDVDSNVSCSEVDIASNSNLISINQMSISGLLNSCVLTIQSNTNSPEMFTINLKLKDTLVDVNTQVYSLITLYLDNQIDVVPLLSKSLLQVKGMYDDFSVKQIENHSFIHGPKLSVSNQELSAVQLGTDSLRVDFLDKQIIQNVVIKQWSDFTLSDYKIYTQPQRAHKITGQVLYSDGTVGDATQWLSLTSLATFMGINKNTIQVSGTGSGTTNVSFINNNKTIEVSSDSNQVSLLSIQGNSNLKTLGSYPYRAVATLADGTIFDVTYDVDWSSDDVNRLIINSYGQALALNEGSVTVKAKFGELISELQVDINEGVLNQIQIQIQPMNYLATSGEKVNFKAIGIYDDGQSIDLTKKVTWSMTNTAIGVLSSNELIVNSATHQNSGITASLGNKSSSVTISVAPANISSLFIPYSPQIKIGDKTQIKVYANYSDGSTSEVTSSVQFKSSDYTTVGVSNESYNKGEITGLKLGTVQLQASYGGLTTTKNVVVANIFNPNIVGIGLKAKYFSGTNFDSYVGERLDSRINFNWSNISKAALGLMDRYSVRWTGFVKPINSGNLVLCTDSDDGVRVKLNNTLVINNWTAHAVTRNCTTSFEVVQNELIPIEVEFFENTGHATIILNWGENSSTQSVIPQTALFPN